jgi:hypothetical protein
MTIKDIDNLNLPDAPDFVSDVIPYTLAEMIIHCEKMLPYWNSIRYAGPQPEIVCEPFVLG